MNAVKTEVYNIKPEKYLLLITNIFIRRYRAAIVGVLSVALVLSIYITDFIYALTVLVFGTFPFILFHVFFKYTGRYDNKYLFVEKKISVDGPTLTIQPIGESCISYTASRIKYGGYAKKNHLFILDDKYMLNIPLESFSDYDTYSEFENWLNTQILRRTYRK